MVDTIKKLEELRKELSEHEHNFDALKEELGRRQEAQKRLDGEVLKAKMLKEGDREKKKEEAEENWERVNEIKAKIEEERSDINHLIFLKNRAEKEALDSMRPAHMESYIKAIRDFIKELKRVQEMEIELRKMRCEGNRVASSIVPSEAYNIPKYPFLPCLKSDLIASDGEYADRNHINSFIVSCRSQGLDID